MTTPTFKKMSDWILISAFFIALGLPLAEKYLPWDPVPIANENRNLASLPQWKWRKKFLQQFPASWEAYYNDHFGWRNSLLYFHSRLIVLGLKQSLNDEIILGKEGWLFTTNDKVLKDYQGFLPLTKEELDYFRLTLEARRDWLAQKGCKFLFVLLPDKQTIYPEYLPDYIRQNAARTRADQLADYLHQFSDITFIDARPLLKKTKSLGTLYYLTDTHWNDLGAWIVAEEILRVLKKDFPKLPEIKLSDFKQKTESFGGDLARVLGLPDLLKEKALKLTPLKPRRSKEISYPVHRITESDDKTLPRALIHRDSFFNALLPFTSDFFQKAIYVWDYTLNTKLVDQEKPDIVILEMVERMIPKLPPVLDSMRDSDLERDFKLSPTLCLDLIHSQKFKKIKTRNVSVTEEKDFWNIQPQAIKAQLVLPQFLFPTNQAIAVAVDINSPIETKLHLFYKIKTDDSYREWRKETKKLKKGFNHCLFYLSHPLIAGRLRFDFPESDKEFQLYRIEARAVNR